MTSAIKSTPVKDLESITGIKPLCDRTYMKMRLQDAKFKRLTDHPMNQRMGRPVCIRLKRNSFLHRTKELIKQNTGLHNHTPEELPTCLSPPPPPPMEIRSPPKHQHENTRHCGQEATDSRIKKRYHRCLSQHTLPL